MRYLVILALFTFCHTAYAGVFEVSLTANHRRSEINTTNYQESTSYTGSISYYFLEMSALEISYTNGTSLLKADTGSEVIQYKTDFEMLGADLVFTFAERSSPFQPFIKAGVAQISKKIITVTSTGKNTNKQDPELVPSAGVGFKIKLTKTFSIKVGVDGWLTNMGEDDETTDYAGRAGISWMF